MTDGEIISKIVTAMMIMIGMNIAGVNMIMAGAGGIIGIAMRFKSLFMCMSRNRFM
jgi:hypothetical protein